MLTIFTTGKPFEGHIGVIQRNALASWKLLHPDCEIILLGDEDGAAEAAADLELKHIPSIARNEVGTPLLDDLFYKAKQAARHEVLAFVNADIILMRDFMAAVEQVVSFRKRFLMIGQRRNAVVTEPLSFDPLWEERLRKLVHRTAAFCAGIDYFVFPRNLWSTVPPFAVGRFFWDNWPVYAARLRKAVVVDATPVVLAAHQNHEYATGVVGGDESYRNWDLIEGPQNLFTTWEASHILTADGIKIRCRSCYPLCVCNLECS
jgi:hypothetical protein